MYGPDQLLLASKKPRIRDLIERSRAMTEEEIKALPEKPDVVRGLLLINLFGEDQTKATVAEKIANLMQKGHVGTPSGDQNSCQMFQIIGPDTWLTVGSSTVEVKNGWHWAQLGDGMIYLSTSPMKVDASGMDALVGMSRCIGHGTLGDHKNLERQRLSGLKPDFIVSLNDGML